MNAKLNPEQPSFRCTKCGESVAQRLIRITRLDPDGRVDFHHVQNGGACGPVVTNFLLPQTGKTSGPGGGWSAPRTLASGVMPWQFGREGIDAQATLRLIERAMITRALQLADTTKHGAGDRAAKLLRMHDSMFRRRLRHHGWRRIYLNKSTEQDTARVEQRAEAS